MRILRTPDANTESASSPAPETAVPSDDKPQSGASSATTENDTPTAGEQPEAKTLAEVIQRRQESASQAETESEGEAAPGGVPEGNKTEEKPAVAEDGKVADGEKEGEKPPPFHEHPAWKRVVEERDTAKAELTRAKEFVEAQERTVAFCKANQIQPEQFREALDLVALINTDPVKAFDKIALVYNELSKFAGKTLPEDLSARVNAGDLKQEDAEEIARLRAEKVVERSKGARASSVNQADVEAQMVKGLNDWKTDKMKVDPDFQRKSELVSDRFQALVNAYKDGKPVNPVRTTADAVALAERAYTDVSKQLRTFAPAPQKRRALTANGASGKTTTEAPKTLNEAIARGLKEKHGITMATNGH